MEKGKENMQSRVDGLKAVQRVPEQATPSGLVVGGVGSQPWWRANVMYSTPTVPGYGGDGSSKSSGVELSDGGSGEVSLSDREPSQSQGNSLEEGNSNFVESHQQMKQSGSEGPYGQEHTHHSTISMPHLMAEYHTPHTQLELGHSGAAYPYTDPFYGGIYTAYGPQPMIHPHLLALHQNRMPLQLDMAEEPVYVNAKQYHGILRRRQSRAKAELEKKVVKVRRPYLHESRHQHAMRRARGCGGRFLNKKKRDGDADPSNEPSNIDNKDSQTDNNDKGTSTRLSTSLQMQTSSGYDHLHSDEAGGQESINIAGNNTFEQPKYANCNGCYQQGGYQYPAFHQNHGGREDGDCVMQSSIVSSSSNPQRALTIK